MHQYSKTHNMDLEKILEQAASLWVFGYGSLTWKPDFTYHRKEVGFIKGFKRRFWQGNVTHRGTVDRIGRVATLIPSLKGKVWGVAFEIKGKDAISEALGGLTTREITLGGYDVKLTEFYPRENRTSEKPVMIYMATADNKLFLGKADTDKMATEIALARGTAGTNTEYVTRLADYIRKHIPEDRDEHLFALDKKVRELERQNFYKCFNDFIGLSELFGRHIANADNQENNNRNKGDVISGSSPLHIRLPNISKDLYNLDTNTTNDYHHEAVH